MVTGACCCVMCCCVVPQTLVGVWCCPKLLQPRVESTEENQMEFERRRKKAVLGRA